MYNYLIYLFLLFSQDYAKNSTKYTSTISSDHVNPLHTKPLDVELETGALDVELDRVNDRLKSVTTDCDKLMDKLSATGIKNQRYNVSTKVI